MQLKLWSEGMDSTFITIIGPKKDAGITTLRVDTEMWNYFPKINKVMKVPPSMMMGPWIGSDFTNDDIVKESSMLDDYDATIDDLTRVNGVLTRLEGVESASSRVYGSALAAVDQKTSGAQILGVHPERESATARMEMKITAARKWPRSIV